VSPGNVEIEDNNNVPEIVKQLEILKMATLEVGVFGPENSTLIIKAAVNEYGAEIEVTDKMRGYLWHKGMNISPDLEKITIPERSYIRSTVDEKIGEWHRKVNKDFERLIDGEMRARTLLNRFGKRASKDIKKKISAIDSPPNHPFTVRGKTTTSGVGDSPLENTGDLKSQITWRIRL